MTDWSMCATAKVVVLDKVRGEAESYQQADRVGAFYGLNALRFRVSGKNDTSAALEAVRKTSTVAVIVSSEALSLIDQQALLNAIDQDRAQSIPMLVSNVTEAAAPELLREMSGGAITGCQSPSIVPAQSVYRIASLKKLTRQLAGQELAARAGRTCSFALDESRGQSVIGLMSGAEELPTFIRSQVGRRELFFCARSTPDSTEPAANACDRAEYQFSVDAALHIFLTHAAGERAWHANRYYANLTIDDPLLTEPYGHVRYAELLREMEQHDFHTTIAFIPWNFDRNDREVLTLFRENNQRLSVCVHGNNHDHREFPALENRPLEVQAANIQQAVARMERFQSVNQLPYDRVMVFPHGIAPEATLGALKRHNFLATANSRNIPLGAAAPADPQFALRPTTLAFAEFPALRRYSAEAPIPTAELAINAFLGNPQLFYVHQGYFAGGIDRFNPVADTVNKLEDRTAWRGLGEIAQHLYLERSGEDGNYYIKAFSSDLHLENVHSKDAVFFIEKEEDFQFPLELLVDGEPHPYSRDGNNIQFAVPIRAGMTRQITIRCPDPADVTAIDISRSSLRVAALRYLSEFRDNFVSRSTFGRNFIRAYTHKQGSVARTICVLSALLMCAALVLLHAAARNP